MKKLIFAITILISNLSQAFFHPAELKEISIGNKSIYNFDDREMISSTTQSDIQELARSVGLIFYKNDLIAGQADSVIFGNLLSEKPPVGNNYCPDEKFADHHNYKPACTGFLIGKDVFVSAGHCFRSKNDCQNKLIVFNITANNEVTNGFKINNNNVFKCVKIISQAYDSTNTMMDYSVVRLDRKADLPVLKVRTKDKIGDDENVFMIGHPLGLPLIYSRDASVDDNSNDVYFKTTLNSFHGNSGSPVFNAKTHLVEGIMVRGESDEIYDEVRQCNRYAVYSTADHEKGEGATRIKAVIPFIYQGFDQ